MYIIYAYNMYSCVQQDIYDIYIYTLHTHTHTHIPGKRRLIPEINLAITLQIVFSILF